MSLFPVAAEVVELALSQVGHTENPAGSNRTPYGAAFGADGNPWCGIFVWWCFDKASGGVDLRRLGIGPAYTPAFHAQAVAHGWQRVPWGAARAGDVAFEDFTAGGDAIEHVELVTGPPTAGGMLPTVGGNTSSSVAGSQSNGGGVFTKLRGPACVVDVLRPPYPGAVAIGRVLHVTTPRYLQGEDVRAVQHLVGVAVDGVYGQVTAGAVRAWQVAHGLHADGAFGPESTRAAGWVWQG